MLQHLVPMGVSVLLCIGPPPRVLGHQPWAYLFLDGILSTVLTFLAGTLRSRGNLRFRLPSCRWQEGQHGAAEDRRWVDMYLYVYTYIYMYVSLF